MSRMRTQHPARRTDGVDFQDLLAAYSTSPAELARKREVIARINRLREEIGPIDIRTEDLLNRSQAEIDRVGNCGPGSD